MDTLVTIGRVVFGGFFVMNGLNHLFKVNDMAGYAKSKGVPSPKLAVVVSGLLILLGGLGLIFNLYVNWSVLLLVVFLLLVAFKMHNFWAMTDPNMKGVPSNTTFSVTGHIIKTSSPAIFDYYKAKLNIINIPRLSGVSERLTP